MTEDGTVAGGPLAGIRVLDLSTIQLGPFATGLMGEWGADVIKIEAPDGDPVRLIPPMRNPKMGSMFLGVSRDKRSLILDLTVAEGQDTLARLAADADVLLHNFRPRPAKKLGVDYDRLRAANPRLVFCTAVGYGSDGRYRDRGAYDDLIQEVSGVAGLIGRYLNGDPKYVPLAMADKAASFMVLGSILAALVHASRTGEGQAIEVPMFESLVHFVATDHLTGRAFEPPLGEAGYVRQLSTFRKPFRTADGYVSVLPFSDDNWRKFFAIAGAPEHFDDPRFATVVARTENTSALYALMEELAVRHPTAHWLAELEKADIPFAPVNSLDDLLADPHLADVGFFADEDHPSEGRLRSWRAPTRFAATPAAHRRPAPRLGEHSVEVLLEAGFGEDEIGELVAKGAVRVGE
ncbi:MAG: CaiB/BaiF CoA transferase family protein [Alphaproteobacteria bacterium]